MPRSTPEMFAGLVIAGLCACIALPACAKGEGSTPVPTNPAKATERSPMGTTLKVVASPELDTRIKSLGYQGAFVLLDPARGTLTASDPAWLDRAFVPASTFKIFNSLVALETGVADSPAYSLPWDGVKRGHDWDREHSLRSAFEASALWYYQEIARRVGYARMHTWLRQADYGNAQIVATDDASEGASQIDSFWLNGALRITARQQVEFLHRLDAGDTSFSPTVVETFLDEVMVYARSPGQVIRAKTGWAMSSDFHPPSSAGFEGNLGWFVGTVQREGAGTVMFAIVLIAPAPAPENFGEDRKSLAFEMLQQLAGVRAP